MRNEYFLTGLDPELVMLIEWDDRNAGPGCEEHHRRFDVLATPKLTVPRETVPWDVEEFIEERGFESLAERRFPVA